MLAAYFDDAGTHDNSEAVVWGGFLGSAEQWSGFDKAWRSKLARPLPGKPPLEKFGLADCERHRPPFSDYTLAESDLLQNECREIILEADLIGLAFAVDRHQWDRLASKAAKEFLGDAETLCFSACFSGAIERARRFFPEDMMLSLHFDRGRKSPKLDAIVKRVTQGYLGSPALVNISFNAVKDFTPLQAADVIATENYWHASSVISGDGRKRPHFEHFLKRGYANGYIMQEADMRETLKLHGL